MNNPQDAGLPRLVRIADAARDLSISERHLREQILRERIPVVRIGKSVRLPRETVERIAREGIPERIPNRTPAAGA